MTLCDNKHRLFRLSNFLRKLQGILFSKGHSACIIAVAWVYVCLDRFDELVHFERHCDSGAGKIGYALLACFFN